MGRLERYNLNKRFQLIRYHMYSRGQESGHTRKGTGVNVGHIPPYVFMMMLAFITGLVTGTAAFLLKTSVRWVSDGVTAHMRPDGFNWILLVAPVAGILLTGIYQRYILHKEIYHGTERINRAIALHQYRLDGDLTYAPMVASTITLGFGGSAGAEGPIAYTGAAIGSNLARLFGGRSSLVRIMLACGAAAGIAGIFKAPMGGVFFSLEVLAITLSTPAIMAIVLAAVTAGLTSYVWSGCTTDLPFHATMAFDWHLMPPVILLGLFCGIYSFYYSSVMTLMKRRYASMGNPWWKNLLSGSVLAILVFLFPALYGEGYSFMSDLLAGNTEAISSYGLFARYGHYALTPVLLALAIIAVKAFACASSNSGGGVAGDFAPTLMAGCVAGFFFAQLSNTCFGTQLPVADFAFIGMGAVMAGAIRAPFMAIFITVEMAQAYDFLFPVTVAAAVSYLVVFCLRRAFRLPSSLPDTY